MPCNNYLTFQRVDHYGKPDLTEQIKINLKHYIDWSMLTIGAWRNITTSSSGIYGGNFYVLREIPDSDYGDNRAFQSIRKDWVFESGVNYESPSVPITSVSFNAAESKNQVTTDYNHYFGVGHSVTVTGNAVYNGNYAVDSLSGTQSLYLNVGTNSGSSAGGEIYGTYNPLVPTVYVDGIARDVDESGYEHHINFPLGQVVFDNAQTGTISASYSIREVQTYLPDDVPWFFEVQYDSMDPRNLHWTQNMNSGDFSVPAQSRIQLPAIVIEPPKRGTSEAYELGSFAAKHHRDFVLHVVSENSTERDNILDLLSKQKESVIWMYDQAKVFNYGVYSLDYQGSPRGFNYPDLVGNDLYRYAKLKFVEVVTSTVETNTPFLYAGVARVTFEAITR